MAIINKLRQLIGTVHSDKMDKTIVVKVQKKEPHPIYRKYINKSKKYYAQDAKNLCSIGDIVIIEESKPLSKLKDGQLRKFNKKQLIKDDTTRNKIKSCR